MFDIEKYKLFLLSNVKREYFLNNNNRYTIDNFIDSLISFDSFTHGKYLGARPGDQIKSAFPTLSEGKPKGVRYHHYFLRLYNYKYCKQCDQVKYLSEFSNYKNSWDGLFSLCKQCDSMRNKIYKNENKEKTKISYSIWYLKNKHIRAAYQAYRRAIKKRATPVWLSPEQKNQIQEKYKEAKTLNMHVDHIVPLNGKYVCGLHVPWNLQLLSPRDNLEKQNYHESEEEWKYDSNNLY